jgi:hypothetical protein
MDPDCRPKLIDALRVKGNVKAFIVKGLPGVLPDISRKFMNAAENPNVFTVKVDGVSYTGIVA